MVLASAAGDVHDWFSWVVIGSNAAVGLWALAAHWQNAFRGKALWACTIAAQLTIFAQAGLGSWLIAREDRQPPELHALYGFAGIVAVGIAYSYRPHLRGRVHLLYAGTGLFLMGLGLRAVFLDS